MSGENRALTPAEFAAFGQPDRAETILREIIRKQPDNLQAALELIRLRLFEGDYAAAEEEIGKARKQWPGESRLKGLEVCAKKGQARHERRARRPGTEKAVDVFTGQTAFHLIRFVFAIVVVSVATAIFYYYIFYLDSTSSLAPRLDPSLVLIRDTVHLVYYLLLIPAAALAFFGPCPLPREPGLNPPRNLQINAKTSGGFAFGSVGRYIPLAVLLLLSFLSQGSTAPMIGMIPPPPTVVFHGGFYFLMAVILFFGLKNLIHFFLLPSLVAVRPDGLLSVSRVGSIFLTWDEVKTIFLVEKSIPHPKEHHWTYWRWLQIETESPSFFPSQFFLRRLPAGSLGRFPKLVALLKKQTSVEPRDARRFKSKSLMGKILFP